MTYIFWLVYDFYRHSRHRQVSTMSQSSGSLQTVIQCYANEIENFDEDHPDRSSGASETRGAGNATMDILHLPYIAREAGIQCPKPFVLQIDKLNDAARIIAMDI